MKKYIYLTLSASLVILSLSYVSAQHVAAAPGDSAQAETNSEKTNSEKTNSEKTNSEKTESADDDSPLFHHSLGGRFLLYTLQGEYEFLWDQSNGIRFGLEGWILFGGAVGVRGIISYRHFLLSSQDKRHHLELGVGPSINAYAVNCDSTSSDDCPTLGNPIALHLGLNYRFQAFNGFLFRFGFEPDVFIFDLNRSFPIFPNMIGMIGYSF